MNISKSIRVALAMKGITQDKFARDIGVSPSYISQVIKKNSASTPLIDKICREVDMTASEFIALGE